MAIREIIVYWIIALTFFFGGAYCLDKFYNKSNWYAWPIIFLSFILCAVGGLATIVSILYWAYQLWIHA